VGSLKRMELWEWEVCESGAEQKSSGFGLYGIVSSIFGCRIERFRVQNETVAAYLLCASTLK
jgi:hypothetical protein